MSIVQLLFRKWWVIALQGILLIILSIYILQNPVAMLIGLSFWLGVMVLATGLLGAISWVGADRSERDGMSLFGSIVTMLIGLLMLTNTLATMSAITVVLGIWLLVTGLQLVRSGWALRHGSGLGWAVLGAGMLSAVAAIMMILNLGAGAAGVSMLLAIPVMAAGIALILLSLAKKSLAGKVKARFEQLGTRGG
jgi:uncharacterized membrane protein HdeD (DUF308 family)